MLDWEARRRSRDLYIGDRALEAHYVEALPEHVCSRDELLAWAAQPGNDARLRVRIEDLVTAMPGPDFTERYPDALECAGQRLPLEYRYDPADERDGVTVRVPAMLVESLRADEIDWLVPGWLEDKVLGLLRTLPKELRRPLVPLPDTAAALVPIVSAERGRRALAEALADALAARFGVALDARAFRLRAICSCALPS